MQFRALRPSERNSVGRRFDSTELPAKHLGPICPKGQKVYSGHIGSLDERGAQEFLEVDVAATRTDRMLPLPDLDFVDVRGGSVRYASR